MEKFGQTGTIGDLYAHYGLDTNTIIDASGEPDIRFADPASQDGGVIGTDLTKSRTSRTPRQIPS